MNFLALLLIIIFQCNPVIVEVIETTLINGEMVETYTVQYRLADIDIHDGTIRYLSDFDEENFPEEL